MQLGDPVWVTVNVSPAIVSVPMRALPVLEATLKPTLPFPFPLAPAVTVIHGALLDAVHAHPALVETVTVVPGPPAESKD